MLHRFLRYVTWAHPAGEWLWKFLAGPRGRLDVSSSRSSLAECSARRFTPRDQAGGPAAVESQAVDGEDLRLLGSLRGWTAAGARRQLRLDGVRGLRPKHDRAGHASRRAFVIPAKAGIHRDAALDPGFRRGDGWTQNEPTHNRFSDWELGVALAATWHAPLPSPATKMWVMDRFWEKGPGEAGASRYAPDSKGNRSTARSCPANHFQNATGPCPRHPPGARRQATKR